MKPKQREYDNPFTNLAVIQYYHQLGKEEEIRQDHKDEWHAVVAATGMIVIGSLMLLLGLAWLL